MIIRKMDDGLTFINIKAALRVRQSDTVLITAAAIITGGELVTAVISTPHSIPPGMYIHRSLGINTLSLTKYEGKARLTPTIPDMNPNTAWEQDTIQVSYETEYMADEVHAACGTYPKHNYLQPFTARCKGQSISVFHSPDDLSIFLISNNVTVVFSDTSLKPPRPLAARTEKKLLIGIPPGLHTWYKNQAVERSTSTNQVMITALQAYNVATVPKPSAT